MGTLDDLLAGDFAANDEFAGTITRQILGSPANTEDVEAAVFEEDSAAGKDGGPAGLESMPDGQRKVRLGMLHVLSTQETDDRDRWLIDGEVWQTVGPPQSRDAGAKSLNLRRVEKISTQRPKLN